MDLATAPLPAELCQGEEWYFGCKIQNNWYYCHPEVESVKEEGKQQVEAGSKTLLNQVCHWTDCSIKTYQRQTVFFCILREHEEKDFYTGVKTFKDL